jgi:flagellar biosynthesis protein FlhA
VSRLAAGLAGLRQSSDLALALGVVLLVVVMVVPLPPLILDFGLAISITTSVLVLMVALFMSRPLDFSSFPTVLLLTTLLRLVLNVATTRAILANGHEGPEAAGAVISVFGQFLMGGDVLVGMIVFIILLIVNFMVVTKGSERIAEVSARFSLDAMPGKQMAIDADLSSGLIGEEQARKRRKELSDESSFFGSMDGASKFVRGDAIAGLISTFINLLAGMAIGIGRHGMPFDEAVMTYSILTVGDGLVGQIPALLISVAAGIVVTKGGTEGSADKALFGQLGGTSKPLGVAAGAAGLMAVLPGMPFLPFMLLAGAAGAASWYRWKAEKAAAVEVPLAPDASAEAPVAATLQIDLLRIELGYGLLALAAGEAPRLTEQIRSLRKSIAQEMGFVLPAVRIQDNLRLDPDEYIVRVKEIEAGRGRLSPPLLLAIDPSGNVPPLPGDRVSEPTFGLPAIWIAEQNRDEALALGCTVVDAAGVLATHLTELVRENMSELLSHAETQKLLDELPREHQRLVSDLIPAQASVGTVQRVLQSLLGERVSIRDLPTILEGIQEAHAIGIRSVAGMVATVRTRLARQISEGVRGPGGYVPMVALSPEWESAFAENITGQGEDRQLTMPASRLAEFMQRLRDTLDAAAASGEAPVLVCSGSVRSHVRAIVERFRPATPVLSQTEIHPRARIRTVGVV